MLVYQYSVLVIHSDIANDADFVVHTKGIDLPSTDTVATGTGIDFPSTDTVATGKAGKVATRRKVATRKKGKTYRASMVFYGINHLSIFNLVLQCKSARCHMNRCDRLYYEATYI